MNLSKNQKIGIGILTFMPIIGIIGYIVSFILIMFGGMGMASDNTSGPPTSFLAGFAMAFVFLIIALVSGLVAMILHIVHITKNEKLKAQNNGQLLWILIIVFANGIGGIIYYFMEILPEPKSN